MTSLRGDASGLGEHGLARRPMNAMTPRTAGPTPEAAEHQALDTVNPVKEIVAGRMPPGAANAEAAHRLKSFKDN